MLKNVLKEILGPFATKLDSIKILIEYYLRLKILRPKLGNYYSLTFPPEKAWFMYPKEGMAPLLKGLGLPRFDVAMEFACGDEHFTPLVREFANEIIGVDIIDSAPHVDRYIKVPMDIQDTYLDELESGSVDAIFSLHVMGVGYDIKRRVNYGDWPPFFLDKHHRVGRYYADFVRVLKPGGYFVLVEWENYPDMRGECSVEYINSHYDEFYTVPELAEFDVVARGFRTDCTGPYLVLRRL